MSEDTTRTAEYLAQHPKMAGVLFTVLLLLSQAGSVAAGIASSNPGP
ncbi:DUF7503 family protein [Natronomonas sp. EA1]